MDHDVRA